MSIFYKFIFRKERMDYYRKREEASKKPTEALSIIIDGMDQSKTNLPHFKGWTRPKVCDMQCILK